ncbi:tRNA (uridine(34)/cytosine(34)/5-carboxymethylaminomethyluridine (34)-2'-O)-methyltransferase TrmL [Pigmentiphaga soli]|uniref:tRNA (cytidine(34)-2'-O)-methyltransferase n=1 Tax=Pigmentiphaga soli TaxID=1007095 RepID=A0ABP8GI34_9BURK
MFHVVLVSPEIPPNTGNVIRLAANTGVRLHLVRPLGFELDDAKLRRAGLDYHEWAAVEVHDDIDAAFAATGAATGRRFAFTTRGSRPLGDISFAPGDALVFGSETAGLAPEVRDRFPPGQRVRLPMRPGQRSLNLSNAVAVAVFEAWRQQGYAGGI